MRALVASLLLPTLSHVPRQAKACAPHPSRTAATAFLVCYAGAMMAFHGTRNVTRKHVRWALSAHAVTLMAAVATLHVATPALSTFAWAVHAVPSAVMWPTAFHLAATRLPFPQSSRHTISFSHTALSFWSLQGPVADALGCATPLFAGPFAWRVGACTVIVATTALCGLVIYPPDRLQGPASSSSSFTLPLVEISATEGRRAFPSSASVALTLASTACKSLTYTTSNWLPSEHGTRIYWLVTATGAGGTLVAGVLADFGIPRTALVLSSIGLAVVLHHPWPLSEECLAIFGALSACSSTLVSICLCADMAKKDGQFARATALIDGGATLLAAAVQYVASTHFASTMVVSSITMVGTAVLVALS